MWLGFLIRQIWVKIYLFEIFTRATPSFNAPGHSLVLNILLMTLIGIKALSENSTKSFTANSIIMSSFQISFIDLTQ